MIIHPLAVVVLMTVFSFAGGLALKQFSVSRDVLWLVTGFSAYAIANVTFIQVMDQSGIARAMVIVSSAQIVLATVAGFYFGERLNAFHAAAVVLSCCAFAFSFAGAQAGNAPCQSPSLTCNEDKVE